MFASPQLPITRSLASGLFQLGLVVMALCPAQADAQYKWVGRDGGVSYSDRLPNEDVQSRKVGESVTAAELNSTLPFAVKYVADKHPVVLYTASDCAPCEQARAHLTKRGVPFSEKRINNAADAQVMEKLGFSDSTVPSLAVGRQKQVGFEASAFDGLLDIAGYPKTSLLPPGYRAPGAEPLTPVEPASARNKPAPQAEAQKQTPRRERSNLPTQTSEAPSARSQNNPNAIRF